MSFYLKNALVTLTTIAVCLLARAAYDDHQRLGATEATVNGIVQWIQKVNAPAQPQAAQPTPAATPKR